MFSAKAIKDIEAALRKYPNKRSAVMDALRIAQADRGGHITQDDMEDISVLLEMPSVEVHAAAAFYTMYNVERPVGRFHVQVCRNISCSLMGAEHIIRYLESRLSVKTGETTPDKKYTLSTVECLGSCGTAPMMQINDEYYEGLNERKIDDILKTLG